MITNFTQARIRNAAIPQAWFSPDTFRFFGTILGELHGAPYGAYFSYTNQGSPSGIPEHRVAYINDDGYVNPSYAGDGSGHLPRSEWNDLMNTKYASALEAAEAARTKARAAWARK